MAGETDDLVLVGGERSDLWEVVGEAAGMQIARSEKWIEWKPGDPFGRIREERRRGRGTGGTTG